MPSLDLRAHSCCQHYCENRSLAGQKGDRARRLQDVHKQGQRSWVPGWVARTCPSSCRSPRQLASGISETAGGARGGVGVPLQTGCTHDPDLLIPGFN